MGDVRKAAVVVSAVGAVLAAALAVVGFGLAGRYRPVSGFVDLAEQEPAAQWSERWLGWQGNLTVALTVVVAVGILLAHRVQGPMPLRRRPGPLVGAGVLALVMALVVAVTGPLVQWDQLGLWAVTTGEHAKGYWFAAFDGDVRLLWADGSEVSQSRYALTAIVHLAAPVVAAVALAGLAVRLRPDRFALEGDARDY